MATEKLWFSVVLIARNEARTLPKLMASLSEFQKRGGEVVLVDTGSTDETAALALSLGCKLDMVSDRFMFEIGPAMARQINRKFVVKGEEPVVKAGDRLFDYSQARNYAATLASNDMVSMPDCDEQWTMLDLDRINQEIEGGVEQLEYNFVFSHDEFGGEAIKFIHSKFYDRRKLTWVGVVHEVLSGVARRQFLGESVMKLEHWQQPSPHRSRYLTGLAMDCFFNPHNDRNSHYLGREMLWTGRPRSAMRELKRHVAMNATAMERGQSMVFIGDAHIALGQEEEGCQWFHKAILTDGTRREAWMRLVHHCWQKNDHHRTAAYASAALAVPLHGYFANNANHYAQEPHEALYWALWYLGDQEGARKHWEKALRFQPLNGKYHGDGGTTFVGGGRLGVYRHMIQEGINFSFVKRGDGEEECMAFAERDGTSRPQGNCDGHPYSMELGQRLKWAFEFLQGKAIVADYRDQAHVNILLHRTDNDLAAVKAFWKSVRHAPRLNKVFVGPKRLQEVAWITQSRFVEVPVVNAFASYDQIFEELKAAHLRPDAIFMFSMGMPAKVMIADLLREAGRRKIQITCLDVGSSFDPLFCEGPTRTVQADRDTLEKLYEDLRQMPLVSIIVPTLGREEKLTRLLGLIKANAGYTNYEVLIESDQFPPNNIGVPKLLKRAVERSGGSLLMYLGNDCLPEPDFLYRAVSRHRKAFPDGTGMVGLNDGYWIDGEFATHWLISKDTVATFDGELFHTGYYHCGCDNELTERMRMRGRYVWAEEAKVFHEHPIQTGFRPEDMDEVYRLAWNPERMAHDRELLRKRSREFGFPVTEQYVRPRKNLETEKLQEPKQGTYENNGTTDGASDGRVRDTALRGHTTFSNC